MAAKVEIYQSLGTGLGYIKASNGQETRPVGIVSPGGAVEVFLPVIQRLGLDLTDLREGLGKELDSLPPASKWTYNPFRN